VWSEPVRIGSPNHVVHGRLCNGGSGEWDIQVEGPIVWGGACGTICPIQPLLEVRGSCYLVSLLSILTVDCRGPKTRQGSDAWTSIGRLPAVPTLTIFGVSGFQYFGMKDTFDELRTDGISISFLRSEIEKRRLCAEVESTVLFKVERSAQSVLPV